MERFFILSYVLVWIVAFLESLCLFALLTKLGHIHRAQTNAEKALITEEGPPIHQPLPDFTGVGLNGKPIGTEDYKGKDWVLILASPGCDPCEKIARAVGPTQKSLRRKMGFLVVIEADRGEAEKMRARSGLSVPVAVDPDSSIRTRMGISRTPYGLLIDTDGVVRMKGVISDRLQLEGLIHRQGRLVSGLVWQTG